VEFIVRNRVSIIAVVLSSALITCGVFTPLGATAGAGGVTPSSVIRTAKLAIAKQASAHVVFVAHAGSPSKTEKIVADVGRASGAETVTEGKADLAIKLSSAYAYVSGNSSGLTAIFGMSSTDAKRVGKDWGSWKAGTSQYANLKSDLTMSSVSALLPNVKGTKLTTVVSGGSTFYVLKWTIPATTSTPGVTNTLMVSSGAVSLPVKETALISNGAKATTTLSRWGEQVVVGVPPSSVTITSSKITG
jgi:hypothetical protein